ncbi:MAG: hypothetical protein WBP31_01120 [Chitinophagales bacterium]|jgi:hypothetical protein|nr:hypothetical protein [Bacteroidota bacterium]MBK9506608.1 hypothetical protein [Bacteroidota bacterium]MBK9554233.1 hypothetical protein [Bacteroidota bacterium]MBP9136551.1 hypothetical protein [Chitinophagales bacterium]
MKTFIADIFPKIQNYSQKLDDLTILANKHWVSIDNITTNKTVYIFRNNSELLISRNGKVEKAKWEYLGNKSLLIEIKEECHLFKHGFFDQNILALKIDSKEEYAVFVNENNFDESLNSIEKVLHQLNEKYLDSKSNSKTQSNIPNKYDEYPPKLTIEEQNVTNKQSEIEERQFITRLLGILIIIIILILFSIITNL